MSKFTGIAGARASMNANSTYDAYGNPGIIGSIPAADFNGGGTADGADFLVWQANFGKTEGATYNEGDGDGDRDVDGNDSTIWQASSGDSIEFLTTNSVANPYTYTGRRFDDETGLYQYRNRYFAAEVGRFLSRDPIGYRGGTNLYEYVGGRPTLGTDPTGLKPAGKIRVWRFAQMFGDSLTNSDMVLNWLPPAGWSTDRKPCGNCTKVGFYQIASTTILWSIRNDTSQQPWHYDRLRGGAEVQDWPSTSINYGNIARLRDTPGYDPLFGISVRGTFMGLRQSFETCAICTDGSPNHGEIFGCIHWGHRIDYNSNREPKPWLKIYFIGPPYAEVDHQLASDRTGNDVDRQPVSFSQLPPKTGVAPTSSFIKELKPIIGNTLRW